MSDLIGISSFKGNLNLPGIEAIQYAPVDWIDNFEELVNDSHELTQPITFTLGHDWLSAPVLPIQQNWTEDDRPDVQGTAYDQTVSAIVTGLRPEVSGEFEKMSDRPFVLKLADRKGATWIIGTPEHGLLFRAPAKTGTAGDADLNDYRISWAGLTKNRAYGYAPVL